MKRADLSRKRILLVDDGALVLASTRMLLEVDGHVVVDAATGAQALEVFAGAEFDLVITDFRMPGMNGGQLTCRIKQAAPGKPVIILTAWPEEVPASVPADMIMSKPYALSELRQAMAHVLGSPPPLSAAGDAAA
ncbi:MAG TPA: response regulator [Verrucomicrobiota bacterium]|jgi:CheY-like chemotaxis protein|nr:response regulator [Verrucomicrobiota bacterium]HNZ77077.1 response regulator [Verrucomicrobiota bacterium]HOH41426.1 response regulator [Verrucomicrobiota bacterium]HPI66466.1 response regulator [Verrucomicrobiota bacterium]HPO44119.1 response regulator [Verrucomicrobiota bacterium]